MNAFSFNFSHGEVIRVRRDSIIHSWALAVGNHWVRLPWKETADAVCVMLWVGALGRDPQVRVES